MSCTDCYNGCPEIQPDTCIKYTGPDFPALGITQYDPLYKVENIILTKLTSVLSGAGIDLSSVDLNCAFVEGLLVGDKNLINMIQMLVDAACSLKASLTQLDEQVNTFVTYETSCLTGLPASPTQAQILQALLLKVCSMSVTLNSIQSDYVKASQLNTLIANFLSSGTSTTQQFTKMVPYVAYEYYGPLSNFDVSGKGLASVGYDKVYICNGSYGTPDKRGRVAVGAVQGVPGGALEAAVDPSLPANAGTGYVINQKFGQSFVTLNQSQIPPHTHVATDSGHSHPITSTMKGDLGGLGAVPAANMTSSESGGSTDTGYANVSISSTGGGQSHDNRQPSIASYFIMYIP